MSLSVPHPPIFADHFNVAPLLKFEGPLNLPESYTSVHLEKEMTISFIFGMEIWRPEKQ